MNSTKRRAALAAVTLISCLSAQANDSAPAVQTQSPLSIKGSARYRAEGDDYTDFSNTRDFSLMRIRADLLWKADPQVSVFFQPQFAKTMGDSEYPTGYQGPTTAASTSATVASSGNGNFDPTLGVHQGYIDYHPLDQVSFLFGRQVLSYGDELIVGAADWNNVGRTFDSVRARMQLPVGTSDIFASKLVDTNITANGTGDKDFYGWYNSLSFGPALKATDFYFLDQRDATRAGSPLNTYALGTRVKSTIQALDYRVEITKELGSGTNFGNDAHQLDGEIGYTMSLPGSPRFGLEGFYAGSNYNQLFPTAHKWLGYADVFGRSNIEGAHASVSAMPFSNLTAQVDFFRFYRPDSTVSPVNTLGNPIFKTNVSGSQDLGSEWDLTLRLQATKVVAFQAGGSLFNEGQYMTDQAGSISPGFYYAQIEAQF